MTGLISFSMHNCIFLTAISFLILLFDTGVHCQNIDPLGKYDDKYIIKFENAMSLVSESNYKDALPLFLDLEKSNPDNANILFHIGLCYLNAPSDKNLAIPYLEKAAGNITLDYYAEDYAETAAPAFAYYFLGQAYHLNYQLDLAIEYFNKFKYYLTVKDQSLIDDANHRIAMCYNTKKLMNNPVTLEATNLGKDINTEYPEYSPVVSSDGSTLIFTSRRKGSFGGRVDEDGQFFEDLYICSFDNKKEKWSKPENIGTNINTNGHEASISLSHDGKYLFIYRADNNYGDIWMSALTGNKWSVPEKLGKEINTKYWETHACLSPDGNTLYFISDKKKGYGGRDIYISTKNGNGQWTEAENIGPQINTQYDEESPFMLADGKTMFFSSKGHESIGGFDIFYTVLDNEGNWSPPKNIGYPVNTTDDDIFYMPLKDGKEAYYASVKKGGFGDKDIYHVSISDKDGRFATLVGKVIDSISNEGIETMIDIIDTEKDEIYASAPSAFGTGEYYFTLPVGRKYSIMINDLYYLPYNKKISITGDATNARVYGLLKLKPAPVSTNKIMLNDKEIVVGERIVLDQVYFDSGSPILKDESHRAITDLYFFLFDNPSLKIEISGHTDDIGTPAEQMELSEARAEAIAKVLLKGGVDENRVIFKGYGATQPLASNDAEEGRAKNRRTEFKVISKYSGESPFYVISSSRPKKTKQEIDVIYSVQISSSKDSTMAGELAIQYGLDQDVFVHQYVDNYKYSAGRFETYREAREYCNFLRENKEIMAFTIAFKNSERISIHEARIITREN
ncbi:MAG: OmpA family protein [Bacteroidetes bacterium]|nr:OmpA family protein [Bacteroidota bacterium]